MFAVIVTTTDRLDLAESLAEKLVAEKLAACVQITPITSFYSWNGKIMRSEEYRLDIKGRAEDFALIEAVIKAAHSYDTPEILMISVADGSAAYLEWVAAATCREK